MNAIQPKTVLFITGAFVGNNCWDQWRLYFEARGYQTLAPAWPHKTGTPETLRNSHPNAEIASNTLGALTEHFSSIATKLPGEVLLVGHSIGGLIVQLLLQKGIGRAGVAIHPVPPQGVLTFKFSFLKAGWRALGFFTSMEKSYLLSFKTWQYAFVNGMDYDVQKDTYYRYAIPESKRVVRDTISKAAKIHFADPRPPLLLIAGSDDHSIPASLTYSNFKRYRKNTSVTMFREFSGRNHFVLAQEGWEEIADHILHWLSEHS